MPEYRLGATRTPSPPLASPAPPPGLPAAAPRAGSIPTAVLCPPWPPAPRPVRTATSICIEIVIPCISLRRRVCRCNPPSVGGCRRLDLQNSARLACASLPGHRVDPGLLDRHVQWGPQGNIDVVEEVSRLGRPVCVALGRWKQRSVHTGGQDRLIGFRSTGAPRDLCATKNAAMRNRPTRCPCLSRAGGRQKGRLGRTSPPRPAPSC